MSRQRHLRWIVILAALALSSAGCHDATLPDSGIAVGAYYLESVTGSGPEAGVFILSADGAAERHVRYVVPPSGTQINLVAIGTFRLRDTGIIEFDLREDSGRSEYVWHAEGERLGQGFSFRYPGPADGNVVETYRRTPFID